MGCNTRHKLYGEAIGVVGYRSEKQVRLPAFALQQ